MKVYALVGKSGTGKSYQAINVCKDRNIESIIDDGLYIYRGNAKAGKSAKRETTKIGAVKTALFNDEEHRNEVASKIKKTNPRSILLIGTSDGMVNKICNRLGLEKIDETIYIVDITTENERKIAEKQRHVQGKHVVPVPTFQLKHQFSGYFISPLRIFKSMGPAAKGGFSEKSVVRPTYSYLGEYIISDKVISDIIKCTAISIPGANEIVRTIADNNNGTLDIKVFAIIDRDMNLVEVAKELQKRSAHMIEEMTAFNINEINIEVRGIA
ncbi:MAG: hypothetical protein RR495_06345 [Anaerovoracaceae bacterium]